MLRVLELFGGIGACSKALERLGVDYEIADYVEIDKYAVKSFNAIHNTKFEPQDICTWNKDIKVDLIMHGSPCQDFSLAGKQAGGDKESGTRSSLMYETIRIVEKLKPKYVIWENVKNLLSKKHRHNFDAYLNKMSEIGYTNYYQVLNAKDYGIPQNRERVFTVSILGNGNYEFPKGNDCDNSIKVVGNYMPSGHDASRIVDENGIAPTVKENHGTVTAVLQRFDFPIKQELKLKLKDMLEEEVDEKFYLSEKMIKYISATGTANFKNPDCKINLDIARPLTTDQNKRAGTTNYLSDDLPNNYDLSVLNKVIKVGNVNPSGRGQNGQVIDADGLARTITTEKGEEQKILIKNATKKGYLDAYEGDGVNISSRMKYQRGNVQKESIQTLTTFGGNDRGVVVSDKPRKDIKELEKYCEYCGNKLERKRFDGRLEDFTVFSNRKYCNRECMRKDWVKIGDNHNQSYSNAHTTARKINELILHKELCELCGSDNNLDIHHIDGNWQNNNLDNLMCLCRSCHTKYERNKDKTELRIRKLTPREVWRLMGFDDADFEKAEKVNSNTQLYKQAGNSIVVNVLEAILKGLNFYEL